MQKIELTGQISRLSSFTVPRIMLLVSLVGASVMLAGCNSSDNGQPIYGVYDGTSADYSRGGVASGGPQVDTGFAVEGAASTNVRVPAKAQSDNDKAGKDTLANTKQDTLVGNRGPDSLSGPGSQDKKDPDSDPLTSQQDPLLSKQESTSEANVNGNFYSYWLRASIVNCTLKVSVNGTDVLVLPGHGPVNISHDVFPGSNRVIIVYTPTDSTSFANMVIEKLAEDQPTCVRFTSSAISAAAKDATQPGAPPRPVTKTFYFNAD